ncbi:MAG: HEPN domain-containing protein [Bacteroidota bacterium]|nr:HEPN domain-containing protein [Bacteroidota bacterium]
MNEKVINWIDISDYDLETAQAMLESKRYLYVGFMCHQSIEKILKACYELIKNDSPPYSHNLNRLIELTNLNSMLSENQNELIFELQPLNIRARYPAYRDALFKYLKSDKCIEIINNTKEFQKWIKEKLEIN